MKTAVVGVGGVGGYLAWQVASQGHDVQLCVRKPFSRLVIRSDGAEHVVAAQVLSGPLQLRTPVDVVILATKAQDTPATAAWLQALCHSGTTVVIAQNGIDHAARVADLVPGSPLLPALVYAAGEVRRPGVVVHHGGHRIVVPPGPPAGVLSALLRGSRAELQIAADFTTTAWQKLLSNLAANALTALTLRRLHVLAEPHLQPLVRRVMEEGIAVAEAEGARLPATLTDDVLRLWASYPASTGSSMLNDRLAGRPFEHEAITGAVVRRAREHGIATPCNDTLLALLRALDASPER